jgi:hypothetical protein
MDVQLKNATYIGLNVTIHIVILFSFLSLFFFLFVSKVEQKAFQQEIANLIDKNVQDTLEPRKEAITPTLKNFIPVLRDVSNLNSGPDVASVKQNILIKFSAVFTVLLLLSICISIVLTLTFDCGKNVPLKEILLENTFTFILVGIIEFIFFTKIAIQYVPASPTLMLKTIIETLKTSIA